MPLTWQNSPSEAVDQLVNAYLESVHAELVRIAQRWAPRIEAWMKRNAPWTDRTGNARQTLFTDVLDIANQAVVIILSHGVGYGVFLELMHAGSFAVVTPALDRFAPLIWRDVVQTLRL